MITPEDVEAEREVILDEIAMHDDDPDDVVHNLFAAKAWGGTPLARPIAGTAESIGRSPGRRSTGTTRPATRPAMTVAVAGNIVHRDVVRRVRKAFSRNGFLADVDARPAPELAEKARTTKPARCRPPALRAGQPGARDAGSDPLRPAPVPAQRAQRRLRRGIELAAVPGGPGASRPGVLGLLVRSGYSDAGMVGVACGSLPSKSAEVLEVVRSELARVVESGLTQDELDRGRGQMRGGMVLCLEDTGSRMTRLGEVELFQERLLSLDEVLERLDPVDPEAVHDLRRELFIRPETLAQVGPAHTH